MKESAYKYNHGDNFVTDNYILDNLDEVFTPAEKKAGIIVSAIMIAFGILAAFAAVPLGIGLGFLLTASLGIYGISQLRAYIQVRSGHRNGWTLASGILYLLFSLLMLWNALGNTYGPFQLLSVLAFTIGFLSMINGIDQITAFLVLKKRQISGAGWILAGGILNFILSILMIANPVLGWFSLSVVWGIYLIVSGIALLAESLSGRRGIHCSTY